MIDERELRRLDEILAHSPLALAALDREYRVSYWSSRAAEMTGYAPEQVLGRRADETPLLHPDDRDRVTRFEGELADGSPEAPSLDIRFLRSDGAVRTSRWSTVVTQAHPTFAAIGVGEDITEAIEAQNALLESEGRFRALFESNPETIVFLDTAGRIVDVNAAIGSYGPHVTRDVMLGKNMRDWLQPEDVQRHEEYLRRAFAGETLSFQTRARSMSGRPLELAVIVVPLLREGIVTGIFCIVRDETAQFEAKHRLQRQERALVESAARIRDLYLIAAGAGRSDVRIRASLEMGTRAFGLSVGAVIETSAPDGARVAQLYRIPDEKGPGDDDLLEMALAAVAEDAPATPLLLACGVVARIDVAGLPFGALVFAGDAHDGFGETDADLLGLISALVAGSIENERTRTSLHALAYYDPLTALPNRTLLGERVRDAIEVAQSRLSRIALLFLDLDGFKDVNDTLGHARGDQLLRLVARRLCDEVGMRATIARMASDEFVVLLADCADADDAREVAERLIAAIAEPFALDEYEQFISASIGVAIYPEDGRDYETLVKNADIAMSTAKERGRSGHFFYNPTLEAPIHMRLSQEKLLRRALELNEFVVYYQPQLDLRDGRISSVEALVRWNHPKSGLIEPAHFIPSAEISGLIVPLGDWVLSTALRQIRVWRESLAPLRLAVNLSARQFHDRELRRRILQRLADESVEPAVLELEITESVAMADAAQTATIVRDLAGSGIRVALDDFGTGYSSLAYLHQFELDVLKVDASFVKGIGRSTSDETIVNTIVGMAHSLDLEVIAEGVETLEQLAFLSAKGCDVVQGWAIAPALPAPEFERFLSERRETPTPSGYGG